MEPSTLSGRTEVRAVQDQPEVWTVHAEGHSEAHDAWSRLLSSTHLPWNIGELLVDVQEFNATVRLRHLADLVLVE